MEWKIFSVMLFSVAAAVLIVNLPLAQATEIGIYYNGALYQTVSLVEPVSVTVAGNGDSVTVSVVNTTKNNIVDVYIYKCGDMEPDECANTVSPDYYLPEDNLVETEYPWSDVKGSGDSGNILVTAKVSLTGGTSYFTFWHRETRIGGNYYDFSDEISSVEAHVTSVNNVLKTRDFILNRMMLPFNWMSRVVFQGAGTLYKLAADTVPAFTGESVQNNEVSSINSNFVFVHPEDQSGQVLGGVTLYNNPEFTCGNGECESGLGEDSANCCLDCGCSSGFYCDVEDGCKRTSNIELSYEYPPYLSVANCFMQHEIPVVVRLNGPPSDVSVSNQMYTLGGLGNFNLPCTEKEKKASYIEYSCIITVPPASPCTENYRVSGNSLSFVVSYTDGTNPVSRTLTDTMPDISVGTWSCGNSLCESELGETSSNCCFDCPCPAGQYCDYNGVDESSSVCKAELSESDISIRNVNPSGFSPHNPAGDTVAFNLEVSNRPAALSLSGYSCQAECSGDVSCSATCSVSCYETASGNTDVYNTTCSLTFMIASYDNTKSYTVTPNITFAASYYRDKMPVQEMLSKTFTIPIGSSYCGDGACGAGETSSNCCFDCPCPAGQYCDYVTGNGFGTGVCRTDDVGVSFESVSQTSFTSHIDSAGLTCPLRTNVTVRVDNAPGDMALMKSECSFSGNTDEFAVCVLPAGGCTRNGDRFVCEIVIPPINYLATAFFDESSKSVVLADNVLNLTLRYNDGGREILKDFSVAFDTLTVSPQASCGNMICDAEFGETVDNCCIDCSYCNQTYSNGIVDWLCIPGGNIPESTCISEEDITVWALVPNLTCDIPPPGREDEGCMFLQTVGAELRFFNAPSDLAAGPFSYSIEGDSEEYEMVCGPEPVGQNQNYSCIFTPPDVTDTNPGTETKKMEIRATIGYSKGGMWTTQVMNVSPKLYITREKSDERKECEELIADTDDEENSLDREIRLAKRLGWGFIIGGALLMIAAIWWREWAFITGCVMVSLGTGAVLYARFMKDTLSKLRDLSDDLKDSCLGGGYSDVIDVNSARLQVMLLSVGISSLMISACTWASGKLFTSPAASTPAEIAPITEPPILPESVGSGESAIVLV